MRNLSRSAPLTGGGTISGDLTIEGDLTVEGDGGFAYSEVLTGDMVIQNTDDDAVGGVLRLQNTRGGTQASPGDGSDGDDAGTISFYSSDDGAGGSTGNLEEMSTILSEVGLNTVGSTAGKLTFKTMADNSSTALLALSGWAGGSHGSDESSIVLNTGLVGIENSSLETWEKDWTALQIGGDGALSAVTTAAPGNDFFISRNTYYDETNSRWEYMSTNGDDEAEVLQLANGMFTVSLTGTAGADDAAVSFTNVMVLDSNSRINLSNNGGAANNTVFGYLAGNALHGNSVYNVLIGHNSGLLIGDGAGYNIFVGYNCGQALAGTDNNIGIGGNAMFSLTAGDNNIAIGRDTLYSIAHDETSNIAIGKSAMADAKQAEAASSGRVLKENIAIGEDALKGGTLASTKDLIGNIAIGFQAMDATNTDAQTGTVAIGHSALGVLTSGIGNVAIGYQALDAAATSDYNTAVGYQALTGVNGDGDGFNTAVGRIAGGLLTDGISNTYVGATAGYTNSTGDNNTYIGMDAGYGSAGGNNSNNTAVGKDALKTVTTGGSNVAIGTASLDELLTGGYNVAVGVNTLHSADGAEAENIAIGVSAGSGVDNDSSAHNVLIGSSTGAGGSGAMTQCIAIGSYAMDATAGNAQTGTVAIGYNSLTSLTSGASNTAIGLDAGEFLTTGSGNTFVGKQSGQGITGTKLTGDSNTAIGKESGVLLQGAAAGNTLLGTSSGAALTTGANNVMIGIAAGDATVDSSNHVIIGAGAGGNGDIVYNGAVAIGYTALHALTSGVGNTAVGNSAAAATATGAYNTVLGMNALTTASGTDSNNTAIGYESMKLMNDNDNDQNTAVGSMAMSAITSGAGDGVANCVAIGYNALVGTSATIGDGTIAIGSGALQVLTTGSGNTAAGFQSGQFITTSSDNTFVGYAAGQGITGAKQTGANNTAFGKDAGLLLQGAAANQTLVGKGAGAAITTGSSNTALGSGAGDLITTGVGNTILGHGADVDAATDSYHVRIGHYGGIKFTTGYFAFGSAYVGTPAAGHAAHSNALVVIPAYSYIRSIYVTVAALNANASAEYTIEYDTTLDVASGATVGGTEILGAGANTSHWHCTSQASQDPSSPPDIISSSGGVVKMTYVSLNKDAASSQGWIGSADVGIYLVHSKSNTATDGGQDSELQITVEYTGVS